MFSSIQMMADVYSLKSPEDFQMAFNNLKAYCDLWQLKVNTRILNVYGFSYKSYGMHRLVMKLPKGTSKNCSDGPKK